MITFLVNFFKKIYIFLSQRALHHSKVCTFRQQTKYTKKNHGRSGMFICNFVSVWKESSTTTSELKINSEKNILCQVNIKPNYKYFLLTIFNINLLGLTCVYLPIFRKRKCLNIYTASKISNAFYTRSSKKFKWLCLDLEKRCEKIFDFSRETLFVLRII